MNRRDLLKQIALLTGGVMVGSELFLSGCTTGSKTEATFTPELIQLLNEAGETIIPTTTTPGAKAAQVGEFMSIWVKDCYTQAEQNAFMKGMMAMEAACNSMNEKTFMDCSPGQRHDFLVSLEKEAKVYNESKQKEDPPHYYTMLKQMTLFGFFTSKTGATETLRFIQVPGKYDGSFPYTKGDRAWAESI
jgi:hypothetical protein